MTEEIRKLSLGIMIMKTCFKMGDSNNFSDGIFLETAVRKNVDISLSHSSYWLTYRTSMC